MEAANPGAALKIDEIQTSLSCFRQIRTDSPIKTQVLRIVINQLRQQKLWHAFCGSRNITYKESSTMPHPTFSRRQSGFTLIEIAIVLVIIGLLLGGILKGQELINSARVKNLATDFRNIPVFIYAYQDKFRALPGDDAAVVAHVGGTLATTGSTPGDGIIDGAWDSNTDTHESFLFWEHIRKAGLAPGSTDITATDYRQLNAVSGRVGIQNTKPFSTMNSGTWFICSGAIPGKLAKQLDVQLDDGVTNTGSMQAGTVASPAGAAVAALDDATQYTVCMGI